MLTLDAGGLHDEHVLGREHVDEDDRLDVDGLHGGGLGGARAAARATVGQLSGGACVGALRRRALSTERRTTRGRERERDRCGAAPLALARPLRATHPSPVRDPLFPLFVTLPFVRSEFVEIDIFYLNIMMNRMKIIWIVFRKISSIMLVFVSLPTFQYESDP